MCNLFPRQMYKKQSYADILSAVDHRPWALPETQWGYYQEWNKPVFLHWSVEPNALQAMLPAELELDTHQGKAWISLVPFTIVIKPRYLPSFPLLSTFDEINLRTYVKYGGKTGVYFLNIEAGKRASSWVARTLSGLPYQYAKMQHRDGLITSANPRQNNRLHLRYEEGKRIAQPSATDLWLSERYTLFTVKNRRVTTYDVHHKPWSLYQPHISELQVDYPDYNHLLVGEPERTHYAHGVQVLAF